jgi:hypothetical protein
MPFARTLVLVLLVLVLALPAGAALAQELASVSLQPVAFVPLADETFTTDVTVENTKDLLGFQFDVNFDPAAFAVESIELGPFLSSTGRSAQPLGPDVRDAASGRVVYGGFTLGAPDQPGAEGSGVLATITWRVIQPADFDATLSRVQLAGPGGQALPGSDTSPRPTVQAAAASPAAAAEQPTATPEPAAPEETSSGISDLLTPLAVVVILVLAVVLFALWRIAHKPGGNRATSSATAPPDSSSDSQS